LMASSHVYRQRTGVKEKRGKGGREEKVSEDINTDQDSPPYEC
jgi:hypothetical protein